MLRVAHAIDIFFAILKFLGSSPAAYAKHCFTYKIFDTVKMVFYLGCILFAVFHETHTTTEAMKDPDFWLRHSEVWIRIELIVFFFQILCSCLFLLAIQINGELGNNNDPNFQRYKNDTLRYYNEDIAWFSYMFVCLCLHLLMLYKYQIKPSEQDQNKKTSYTIYMLVFSIIRLVLLMPYRSADRQFTEFANWRWITVFIFELLGAISFFFFKRVRGSNTFACCLIDSICLISMFFIYKINEAANANPPENKQPLLKCLNVSPQSKQKLLERKDKKVRQLKVDNSIYNMALYTLIDPVIIEENQKNYYEQSDKATDIVTNIHLNDKDKDGIFFGLTVVVGIQIITVVLIFNEFVLTIKPVPVKEYWILIPRIIASFYMHSTLAAEITNGLDTMKYVVNHPAHFLRRGLESDDSEKTSQEDGWYIRFIYAFLLGFIQYILTIILEVMTIVFLNSLDSYLFILLCYAALAGVTTFDNMYANALSSDHTIKKVIGKNFFISFHRFMKFSKEREEVEGTQNIQDKVEGQTELNLANQS